jgi:hypothetical protein
MVRRYSGRNRHHICQAGGNIAFSVGIPTPSRYRAVALERQDMLITPGNRHCVRQARGNIGLAVRVVTPGNDAGWNPNS